MYSLKLRKLYHCTEVITPEKPEPHGEVKKGVNTFNYRARDPGRANPSC